jgi:pullulanase/glycogen debranching enzyme
MDIIRVGLAGNLADYELREGVTGKDVDYNGSPSGYGADPQEHIVYIGKHDNQTYFDYSQYKAPFGWSTEMRTRAQNVGSSVILLGQGIPFIHLGQDMLRSKSMQRDSYDSGDWFNKVDFTYTTNNWNVGLPRQDKDGDNWGLIQEILTNADINVQQENIMFAKDVFAEFLSIRDSSPLFGLETLAEVQDRVSFLNQGNDPQGVIVMRLMDMACGSHVDAMNEGIMVVFNPTLSSIDFAVDGAAEYQLHPVQAASVDTTAQTASFAGGTFTVPAQTTGVFVKPRGAACN